jgi:hypothetical protein
MEHQQQAVTQLRQTVQQQQQQLQQQQQHQQQHQQYLQQQQQLLGYMQPTLYPQPWGLGQQALPAAPNPWSALLMAQGLAGTMDAPAPTISPFQM